MDVHRLFKTILPLRVYSKSSCIFNHSGTCRIAFRLLLCPLAAAQILFLCRHPSPDMPFRFVDIQNPSDLCRQQGIQAFNPFRNVFMNCRFAASKMSGGFPDGSAGFHDIFCFPKRPQLFIVPFQSCQPPYGAFYRSLCRGWPVHFPKRVKKTVTFLPFPIAADIHRG